MFLLVNCCYHFIHNRETLESFRQQNVGISQLALALGHSDDVSILFLCKDSTIHIVVVLRTYMSTTVLYNTRQRKNVITIGPALI